MRRNMGPIARPAHEDLEDLSRSAKKQVFIISSIILRIKGRRIPLAT